MVSLSRLGQLPTVWSNCLAGWFLGGGGYSDSLIKILPAATLLYLGGTFLNDAFDAEHDRVHQAHRPIPSGAVTETQVWRWGLYLLVSGGLLMFAAGVPTGLFGLALILCIVLHNSVPSLPWLAPSLLGICRFLLYPLSAASGQDGVTGESLWCGIAMGAYATGTVYISRHLPEKGIDRYSPLLLMAVPLFLAYVLNGGTYRDAAILLAFVVVLWTARCLRRLWGKPGMPFQALAGLTAGIVFVDWLALAHMPRHTGIIFLPLFAFTLLLQKLEQKTTPAPKPPAPQP